MKLSPKKFVQYRTYSHHDRDIDDLEDEFWPMMGILFALFGVWTGVIHLIDWLTFDFIAWYIEPFTIIPLIILVIMKERFDSLNPMHWWPMFWGYKVNLPEEDKIKIYPLDGEDLLKKYGGPLHVHIIDYQTIKFRKQKDAVIFGLTNF